MNHRPLLAFMLALAAGILASLEWGSPATLFLILGASGLVVLLSVRHPAAFLGGIILLGMAAGGLRTIWYATLCPSDISHFTQGELDRGPYVTLSGAAASEPESAHDRQTFYLSVDRIKISGRQWRVTGEAYLSIPESTTYPVGYGDRIDATGFLVRPRGATNPGGFDWAGYLNRRGVGCTMAVSSPGAVHQDTAGSGSLLRGASALRSRVQSKSADALPAAQAAVLGGIMVGTGAAIPPDLRADFVHTGTAHILASAGLHVGVLLLCILGLAKAAGAPRKLGAALGIAALIVFMFAAGGRPAVVRASIVGIVWLTGKLFEREPDFLTSLGLSAGIILWCQPTALLEPGFQLSFATVGILCAAMPGWKRLTETNFGVIKLKGVKRTAATWIVDLIGVAIFADLGSLPIVAANYNEISICGILANIAVVPLVFLIIPIGCLAVASPGIVSIALFKLAGLLVTWVDATVRFFSNIPLAYIAVPSPSPLTIVLYYAVLLTVAILLDQKTRAMEKSIEAHPL